MSRVLIGLIVVGLVIAAVMLLAGRVRTGLDGPTPSLDPPRALPGWYPDPGGSGRDRWWDGLAWTDDYRDGPGTLGG